MRWVSTKEQLPSSKDADSTGLLFVKYKDNSQEIFKEVVSVKDLIKFVKTTGQEYFWLKEEGKI
jgi:hypothetical protein